MKHILTINIEDYYQVDAFSELIPLHEWERFEDRIRRNTESTLELLAETGSSATFFVSQWIAEKHGALLRGITEAGHEVAAQGDHQRTVRGVPPDIFRHEVRRVRESLEDAIGRQVIGFRLGRGWIGPDDLWALDALHAEGYVYDASLCPLGAQFRDAPERHGIHVAGPDNALLEVPVSTLRIAGYALPFAGGNYLRQLPAWFTAYAARYWTGQRGQPLVMYFHTWELDAAQPSITAAGPLARLRHYRNLAGMRARLSSLLAAYPCESVQTHLGLRSAALAAARSAVVDPKVTPAPLAATASLSSIAGELPHALSIVVPCYNEEAAIPYLARTLTAFAQASAAHFALEFVLVDDGSSDATWAELERAFGAEPRARLVRHPRNRGIAAAIMTGMGAAESEYVAVIDADCTFDPFQIAQMFPLLAEGVSVVVASPFHAAGSVRNVPAWRLLLSRGATALYRRVFRNQLSSYTSCFRIYRRAALAGLVLRNEGFCGVTEILAELDLAGHRFVECPVALQVRLLGQSKIRLLQVTGDHLRLLGRLAMRRLYATSSLGAGGA